MKRFDWFSTLKKYCKLRAKLAKIPLEKRFEPEHDALWNKIKALEKVYDEVFGKEELWWTWLTMLSIHNFEKPGLFEFLASNRLNHSSAHPASSSHPLLLEYQVQRLSRDLGKSHNHSLEKIKRC